MISNSAETIEQLSRKLERQKILMMLLECKTLEDYEEVVRKLKAQDKY